MIKDYVEVVEHILFQLRDFSVRDNLGIAFTVESRWLTGFAKAMRN